MDILLDRIECVVDEADVLKRIGVDGQSEIAAELAPVIERAAAAARPKALYRPAFVQARHDNSVVLEGVEFHSRVLRQKLDKVERVFAYVATCGRELDGLGLPADDFMGQYCLDVVKQIALTAASRGLRQAVEARFHPGKLASMNPGSGPAHLWPIEEQKALFSLLGDVESRLGVTLTDSCLMIPNKTISGVMFPAEVDFSSCRYCPRESCPSRGAAFDPEAHREAAPAPEIAEEDVHDAL